MTWTLSDPSDIIGTTVGGNRYGWFVTDEFPFLAFDTSALIGFQDYCTVPPSTAGAKVTAGGWITSCRRQGDVRPDCEGEREWDAERKPHVSGPRGSGQDRQEYRCHVRDRHGQLRPDSGHGDGQRYAGSFGFQVDVCDNGEPGKDADTFSIVHE